MPIGTPVLLTNGEEDLDQSSYATASFTPTAGRLVVVGVSSQVASANTPTLTGNGVTYTERGVVGWSAAPTVRKLTVFTASAGSSGAITIDFAAQVQSGCMWIVLEIPGCNLVTPVPQVATASTGYVAGDITATLGAFADVANATLAFATGDTDTYTWTAGTGFTELVDFTGNICGNFMCQYQLANDTSVNATPSATQEKGMVALEIAATGGGGGSGVAPGLRGLSVFRSKGRRYWYGWKPERSGLFVPAQARERLVRAA